MMHFEKLEHVDPNNLLVENSVEEFKCLVEKAYEPIEDYRVGKIMEEFLDDCARRKDQ